MIFGHVIPLAPALQSCDVHSVVNVTITLHRSRQLKLGVT